MLLLPVERQELLLQLRAGVQLGGRNALQPRPANQRVSGLLLAAPQPQLFCFVSVRISLLYTQSTWLTVSTPSSHMPVLYVQSWS